MTSNTQTQSFHNKIIKYNNGGRRNTFNDFSCIDSRYIYATEKEFLSEDAVNVFTDEEDATKR